MATEETGLPEGLDPGHTWETATPEQRSEPIPTSHGSRLVGLTEEETQALLAEEEKAKKETAAAEEKAAKDAEAASAKTTAKSSA